MVDTVKQRGVQFPVCMVKVLTYDELTSGAATALLGLPAGAVVIGGEITVNTAWDTGTSAVLDLGDADDDDRYTSTQINLKSAARTALTLTGYKYPAAIDLDAIVTEVGTASTAGEATIVVMYIEPGRQHESTE